MRISNGGVVLRHAVQRELAHAHLIQQGKKRKPEKET
jgi:hypothetical protein